MASRCVELTQTEAIVLGTVTNRRCLSSTECSFWTNLPVGKIEEAITALIRHRLIYLSGRGLPKRYSLTRVKVAKKEETTNQADPDQDYIREADLAEQLNE